MSDDLAKLSETAESADPVLDAAGELEQKLEQAIDERYEERFLWVIVCVVLADVTPACAARAAHASATLRA